MSVLLGQRETTRIIPPPGEGACQPPSCSCPQRQTGKSRLTARLISSSITRRLPARHEPVNPPAVVRDVQLTRRVLPEGADAHGGRQQLLVGPHRRRLPPLLPVAARRGRRVTADPAVRPGRG